MKIISAHQPAYLPWLGYFHKIMISDTFVLMDDVQYEKNSFISRNKVLQGAKPFWLTVPVITKDYKKKTIRDIKLLDQKWKRKHLMSIQQSYKKAPFFEEVMPLVEESLSVDSSFLIDHTNAQLKIWLSYLEIDAELKWASELDIQSRKLEYVIELTQKVEGNIFVFGGKGKDYADTDILAAAQIKPHFQEYHHPQYDQGNFEFVPYMSVIDGMFRVGKGLKDLIMANNINSDQLRYDYVRNVHIQ